MKLSIFIVLLFFLYSCASPKKEINLTIGMSENDVIGKLGKPKTREQFNRETHLTYLAFNWSENRLIILRDNKFVENMCLFMGNNQLQPKILVTGESFAKEPGKDIAKGKIIILPEDKKSNPNDLEFKKYARKLGVHLQSLGYEVVSDKEKATQAVLLSFSLEKEKVATHQKSNSSGIAAPVGYGMAVAGGSGSATITEEFECIKKAKIQLVDFKKFETKNEIDAFWEVRTKHKAGTCEFHKIYPALVIAATSYIGSETHDSFAMDVYPVDKRFVDIATK